MAEQQFREIQLSGKQLVFLFMTSVALAVGVFLLGVILFLPRGIVGTVSHWWGERQARRAAASDGEPGADPAPKPAE